MLTDTSRTAAWGRIAVQATLSSQPEAYYFARQAAHAARCVHSFTWTDERGTVHRERCYGKPRHEGPHGFPKGDK